MSTAGQVKPAPAGKSDAYLNDHLGRALGRIRNLDIAAGVLGFLIGTLVYALGMALLDRMLDLPTSARLIIFGLYALSSAVYLGLTVLRPIWRHINPYYAARQVEQTVPGAKNSIVNWLDLRRQKLPPAIRSALTQRAARDAREASLETAISARRAAWLGGVAGGLFVLLVVLFLWLGAPQFFSLLGRSFLPFREITIASKTTLQVIQPEGGNVTIPVGRAVSITVLVGGKVPDPRKPDALKLLYHYHTNEPYEEIALERGEASDQWVAMVPAFEVHDGFWYQVTGGDSQTPEYRVQVRSSPLVTSFEVNYHFRPYLHWSDQSAKDPNLKGMRGTQVTLVAHTNRKLKEGHVEIGGNNLPSELTDDAQAMLFRLVLEKNSTYVIRFTSNEGERNSDPLPYTIEVLDDHPPRVTLSRPEPEIHLPANGILQVEGLASDDFGVTGLALQMKINGEEPPQARPYRPKQSFRYPDGTYPQSLEYKDFVELEKVKLRSGQSLQKGMVIEYWLEATDTCDFPGPNVGRSEPPYRVVIDDAEQDRDKVDQERRQAQQEQKQHEQKQDVQQAQQSKEHQAGEKPEQGKEGQGTDNRSQEQKELDRKAEEIQKALEQQKKDEDKGEAKGDNQESKGEGKDSGGNQGASEKPQDQKGDGKPQPDQSGQGGQSKEGGKSEPGKEGSKDQGESKTPPQEQGNSGQQTGDKSQKPDQQEGKGDSKSQPSQEGGSKKDEGKPDQGKPGNQEPKGSDKGDSKQGAGQSGQGQQGKDKDQPKQGENAGQDKGEGGGTPQKKPGSGEKGKGGEAQLTGGAKGESQSKGAGKSGSGDQGGTAGEAKETPKETGNQAGKEDLAKGAGKPSPDKSTESVVKGETKDDQGSGQQAKPGDSGEGGNQEHGTADSVADLAKQLQNGDAQAKEQARQKLSDLKNNAKDAAVQQAAAEALKKEGASGEQKPGGEQKPDPAVKDLAEKLKSDNAKERGEAAQKLDDLARNAQDEKVRQAARDALKDAGKSGNPKPEEGPNKGTQPGEKNPGENPTGKQEGTKPGDPEKGNNPNSTEKGPKPRPEDAGQPGSEKGNSSEGTKGPRTGEKSGPHTGKGNDPGEKRDLTGDTPGANNTGSREMKPSSGPTSAPPKSSDPADPANKRKAGELQLEEFRKHARDKDLLKKMGWNEQQMQDYLKSLEAARKKQQSEPPPAEPLPETKVTGSNPLYNSGPQKVKGGTGSDDKVSSMGPAQAPPPFRDAARKWSEELSNLERAREKK